MFASNSSQVSSDAVFIEDVFSTYLYTGNSTSGGTQTITNNIDLSTKGGMVWIKGRSAASDHILSDTARGAGASATNNNALASNLTSAEDLGGSSYDFLSAFNADGFTVKQGGTTTATRGANYNNVTYTSWTFRKQPKFFDIVTYTGNGVDRNISHNLGSAPGCVIIKQTNGAGTWRVWHRSGNQAYNFGINLNSTGAYQDQGTNLWGSSGNANMTSTTFSVGGATGGQGQTDTNSNGNSFIAYLFAHNAGGFGLSGTDNVISCGSFTTDGSGKATVNLGYEPQFIIYKRTDATSSWETLDVMRAWFNAASSNEARLYPNTSDAEGLSNSDRWPTSTGFQYEGFASATYIYIAIRRGPMKVPTSGTSVYKAITRTGNGVETTVTGAGFPVDFAMTMNRSGVADKMGVIDRLRNDLALLTAATNAEAATWFPTSCFAQQDGIVVGTTRVSNGNAETYVNQFLRRAPSFMDVVCDTGTGSVRTVAHNLGVVPEFIIRKMRSGVAGWYCYHSALGNTDAIRINSTSATASDVGYWNNTSPTSTQFTVGTSGDTNQNTATFVTYLFASCPGVSKVGSYTGSGTTKQIDCGFTGGARLVIIKRTDSTGAWYIWDSARGIVAGNDPYLLLNSIDAEVTNTDYVDTYSAGFEISSTAPAAINANGGTYIYLAIA